MGKKSRRVKPAKAQMPYVARTFEGIPGECDLVAMREMVPSATALIKLLDSDRIVRLCSLLPGAAAGIVRPDGEIWVGLQVVHNYGDISRDLAHAIEIALTTDPGNPVTMNDPGVGPRLQDLIDVSAPFSVDVLDGFDYWLADTDTSEETAGYLAAANDSINPTVRLRGVDAAYWTALGARTFLRWVRPEDEALLLNALARLHHRGQSELGAGNRLIGMFRAHALLVPVWELPSGVEAADLEAPAAAFAALLAETLLDAAPLTVEERSARNGLANRQLTIR